MHEKQWKVIYILGPQFLPYTPEKFEIAALFLRLDLPCTLIRHENKPGEFKNACFAFQCERKKKKTEIFGNDAQRHDNRNFPT